ncbi:MAG TPA: kelch repeat-containing protein [Thermoanaerobaculia bacterium]
MASWTHMFAAVSIDASRFAKLLLRIAPCLALLVLATAATAQMQGPAPGEWGMRAPTLEPLSELALAEANGKLYLMGGYPASRVTATTVQVYDIATDTWAYGPPLPMRNNHGMAASVNGKIYLIGGQLNADDPPNSNSYVNTVYELDPAVGVWVTKAPMPTARSSGFAVAHDGKIYVAGGRLPRGSDFAVYDPAANTWEVLPNLPTQRNHFNGAAINGRIHYVGGRQGNGLSPLMTTVHEVYDPQTKTWTTAAPMLRPRSGMNSVMARGLFHVWGGEGPAGMFPDHDYYNPQTNTWTELPDMPMPVHGIVGSAFVDGLIWATGGGIHIGGSSGSTMNQVYRPAVALAVPGTLSFSLPAFSVVESAGSATIEVQRTDGSDGAVSVAYTVTGGTAIDGPDYQSVSGVLSWSDGDTASKTFTVPVFNNAATGDPKTVTITLASPTGGSLLGTHIVSTLTILDDDRARRRAATK